MIRSSEVVKYRDNTVKPKNLRYERKNLIFFYTFNHIHKHLKLFLKLYCSYFILNAINNKLFLKIINYYTLPALNAEKIDIFPLYPYLIRIINFSTI